MVTLGFDIMPQGLNISHKTRRFPLAIKALIKGQIIDYKSSHGRWLDNALL